ncbi:MAG: cation diffusion facilitator family transporter [Minisyncoccota bacterium]
MSSDHSRSDKPHPHPIPASFGRAFAIGAALNIIFVIVEVVYGIASHSTALLADAAHNTGDVIGLLLAWGAYTLAKKSPSIQYTYGLGSTTILAALANGMLLLVATGAILWEAIQRIASPAPVEGGTVIVVAAIGIGINSFAAFLLARGKDLNIRSAFWHLAADAGVSAGVVVTGIIILYTGASWADPAASILISIAIVWSTWGLFRDAVRLSLQAVPAGIDLSKIRAYLKGLPGVESVHDLHVWPISTTDTALTAHLVMPAVPKGDLSHDIAEEMRRQFSIGHATVQIELPQDAGKCHLEPDDVI